MGERLFARDPAGQRLRIEVNSVHMRPVQQSQLALAVQVKGAVANRDPMERVVMEDRGHQRRATPAWPTNAASSGLEKPNASYWDCRPPICRALPKTSGIRLVPAERVVDEWNQHKARPAQFDRIATREQRGAVDEITVEINEAV